MSIGFRKGGGTGGGGGSFAEIMWQPGGEKTTNVVTEWADVKAAIDAAQGAIVVWIDPDGASTFDETGLVPLLTIDAVTNCQNKTWFKYWRHFDGSVANPHLFLEVADEMLLQNPLGFDGAIVVTNRRAAPASSPVFFGAKSTLHLTNGAQLLNQSNDVPLVTLAAPMTLITSVGGHIGSTSDAPAIFVSNYTHLQWIARSNEGAELDQRALGNSSSVVRGAVLLVTDGTYPLAQGLDPAIWTHGKESVTLTHVAGFDQSVNASAIVGVADAVLSLDGVGAIPSQSNKWRVTAHVEVTTADASSDVAVTLRRGGTVIAGAPVVTTTATPTQPGHASITWVDISGTFSEIHNLDPAYYGVQATPSAGTAITGPASSWSLLVEEITATLRQVT